MKHPDVSIVLVSWNTRALTIACLDSLPGSVDDDLSYEVIAVDNGSRDGSCEALAPRGDVELIANATNRGYAAAVNQAYVRARGELILLLNSDIRLAPGALSELARFLRARRDAAGVAPVYVNPNGSPQAHYYRLPTFGTALALATGLRLLPPLRGRFSAYRMLDDEFSRPRPVPQPSASCLLLRRSLLPPDRLLDERYPIFFNDVDLARLLAARGAELWMTPAAVARHELGASTRLLGPALARQHLGALVRYVAATQNRQRLFLFQALAFADRLVRRLLRQRGALPFGDLWAAVRGDPGPLPELDPRTWVVYLSGVPWRCGAHRQHELARQLARGRRVLFVDPPGLSVSWKLRPERVAESLWHAEPPAILPLGRFFPLANRLNRRFAARRLRSWLDRRPGPRLLWVDEDLAAPVIGRLGEEACIYDAADLDWTFTRSWNRWHLRRALDRAVRGADLVLASSAPLSRTLSATRRAFVLHNACDPDHFCPEGKETALLDAIPPPRLGYAGAIDERAFHAHLIATVARLRPNWSLVLIGPSTPGARRALSGLANVHLVGALPYDEVPPVLRGIDVCLIPYRTDGRASYVHPKKLYEYLALGKPVVATSLPALHSSDAPLGRGDTPETFVVAVEAALARARIPDEVRRRREVAGRNSWDERGARVRALLDELEGKAA